MTLPRRLLLCSCLLALVGAPARADEPDAAVGTVLAVDGATIYLDLGAADGVSAGATLELVQTVVATDPVSHQTLQDRFALGQLTVSRSGDHLAVAAAEAALSGRVRAGDAVRLTSVRSEVVDPWQARRAERRRAEGLAPADGDDDTARAAARVADAELTRATWQATLGRPPAERIAAWRALLARAPHLTYRPAVEGEIASLARQAAELARATAASDPRAAALALGRRLAAVDPAAATDAPIEFAPPAEVSEGQDLPLAFAERAPGTIRRGSLFVRRAGETAYERLALVADGDGYLRATIPAAAVRQPALELFVEVEADDGLLAAALASSEAPRTIEVEPAAIEPPPILVGRSEVTVAAEYVDFDGRLGQGFDQYYQAEADFLYRFHHPIYAMRLGFGTMSGTGGPKDVIDADPANQCRDASGTYRCQRLTYSYIYAEIEHRFSPEVALMVRPQAGRLTTDLRATGDHDCTGGADTTDCAFDHGLGGRVRLRLGAETATNLALGVGVTSNVGTLFEAAYSWNAYPVFPVRVAVQVTDMPVRSDFGVRLVTDVGWRILPWLYPALRVSYQARDVDHAGFSGGGAVHFDW